MGSNPWARPVKIPHGLIGLRSRDDNDLAKADLAGSSSTSMVRARGLPQLIPQPSRPRPHTLEALIAGTVYGSG